MPQLTSRTTRRLRRARKTAWCWPAALADGRGTTTNHTDRWPDQLFDRLGPAEGVAVANQAAGGNLPYDAEATARWPGTRSTTGSGAAAGSTP
ncbi:hypothetical protein E1267_23555 [Nonomuraea longispora]|uniref:Uncharacterized protein n=1 Tax=Nonomuraea longispora TaxID=1848320 RepID=A0A4R4N5Y7_9ACTN|nr:hypothetical protein [Nonomuraea longispora]TDC04249.1 hypothetical protein E1267_23555 [Nonomuraea longispora]